MSRRRDAAAAGAGNDGAGVGRRADGTRSLRVWAWYGYGWLVIVLVAPLLRVFGLAGTTRFLRFVAARPRGRTPPADPIRYAHRMTMLAHRVARYSPFRAKCLEICTTVWFLLLRRNVTSEIVLGSRMQGDTFESHAWVRLGDTVVTEPESGENAWVEFRPTAVPRRGGGFRT